MCESPRLRFCTNLGGSYQKCSPRVERVSSSESQLSFVDEFGSGCSFNSEGFSSSGEARIGVKIHSIHPYRFQLEQEVQRLQQKLHEEMELHAALESAVGHAAITFSHLSSLPYDAENLLCNISMLEFTVSKLEEEMVSLHFQLSQERNERRLVEYRLKQSPSQSLLCSLNSTPCSATLMGSEQSMSQLQYATEEVSCQESREPDSESSSRTRPCSETLNAGCSAMLLQDQKIPTKVLQHVAVGKQSKWKSVKGLWNRPNQLSEEMVRCMKNIFICLSDSSTTGSSKLSPLEGLCSPVSPHGNISRSSSSFSEPSTSLPQAQSPRVEFQRNSNVLAADNTFDPYKVCGKLSWGNIGSYSLAIEVSLMSVGKKQLKYASGILRRFRLLVEQLAKVNPVHLSYDEKLAFWINLYNALIMHAYLAYGVPRSDLKLFSLMQKAAYTVGGHSFNATAIEFVILKLKPPAHRPQSALLLALHKLKMSDEQRKYSIDTCEPLVAFALSCGMYSSPAVRIYTAGNVREELLEAQRDFIRASFAVSSKGKLLVPKMLHCFAKGFINEDAALAVWISQFLPPQQAALVDYCMAQRRQKRLGARNCVVLPFDSRFRYLFMPENRL